MTERPNVVLVTIDSLRADRAAPEAGLMPTLEGLGEDGVRCTDAFSNGYSTPVAFPSILTGTYPDHYGGMGYMSDRRPFLASFVREAGYRTGAFHSNPHLRAEKNYDTGFEAYADFESDADSTTRLRYLVTKNLDSDSRLYALLRRIYHLFHTASEGADYIQAPEINDRLLSWVDSLDADEPFFAWAHYMDVHYPFYPPDEFVEASTGPISSRRAVSLNGKMQENPESLTEEDRRDLVALYEGDVRYTDHYLGELLRGFEERGLRENTVFVVTSDHGELFGEYGLYGHPPTTYDESLHVPLVLSGPGVPAGESVDDAVSLVDLAPTIADLLDREPRSKWTGRSLFDPASREDSIAFLGTHRVLAAQTEAFRLTWWREVDHPEEPTREWELVDRTTGERVDPAEHPAIRERLEDALRDYLAEADETDERLPDAETDEDVEERLEALGYK